MAQRSPIQLRPLQPPLGQEAVHQLGEPVIVVSLQEMRHLMNDDALKALNRLLGQFQIQPDAARVDVADAPLGPPRK
jgi:hypothetical protein